MNWSSLLTTCATSCISGLADEVVEGELQPGILCLGTSQSPRSSSDQGVYGVSGVRGQHIVESAELSTFSSKLLDTDAVLVCSVDAAIHVNGESTRLVFPLSCIPYIMLSWHILFKLI